MVLVIAVLLLVVGAILVTGAIDLPAAVADVVQADVVGWICLGVGALGALLGVLSARQGGGR